MAFYEESKTVQLIGQLKETLIYDEINEQWLGYNFDVIPLQDYEDNELRGCELGNRIIFNSINNIELHITSEDVYKLNEDISHDREYCRLSSRELRFLSSLNEGDVITFWARIPMDIWLNEDASFRLAVWDFERYEGNDASEKLKSLIDELH